MARRMVHRAAAVAAILWAATLGWAQEIIATPRNAGGIYDIGETIQWRLQAKGEVSEVRYVVKKGGLSPMGQGVVPLTGGVGTLETVLQEPGSVLVELEAVAPGKKPVKSLVGALVAPSRIQASAAKPADFDAFWKARIDELQAVPTNPVVEAGDSGKPTVDYCKVRLDNIRGTHVYGQLARPKREGKFPALLLVQYAGVYPLPKQNVTGAAEAGWLALNIMAHDLPFDKPEAFYKELSQTTLRDYTMQGNDDREKSYYLRMYLGCYRAADYLAQRPDWDGRTLVVSGTSQGGLQAIVTAGIHPKITAMMANVPAGCDTTGPWIGRAGGHPYWHNNARGKDNEKRIMETSRYFDVVNFAMNVKCPALVAIGLIDVTCPPAGVYAACNRMQGPKEVVVMVNSGHKDQNNSQAPWRTRSAVWNRALVNGAAVPPRE